jgi:hypothetical protein
MIDPIGNIEVDPVVRLRDSGLVLQQPERERIAKEIEGLRSWQRARLEQHDQMNAELGRMRAALGSARAYVIHATEDTRLSPTGREVAADRLAEINAVLGFRSPAHDDNPRH